MVMVRQLNGNGKELNGNGKRKRLPMWEPYLCVRRKSSGGFLFNSAHRYLPGL